MYYTHWLIYWGLCAHQMCTQLLIMLYCNIVCHLALIFSKRSCLLIDIEVACYHYEGIDAVKSALKTGLTVSTEDMAVKVSTLNCLLIGSCKNVFVVS